MACASVSLPSCYLGVVGVNDTFANGDTVCCMLSHGPSIFIKPSPSTHLSYTPSPVPSLSQYRAVFCQCCRVGTSHLLLLQRDSHGVQLPGEGMDVALMKTHRPAPLNSQHSHRGAAGPFRASFKSTVEEYVDVSLKCNTMKGDASIISLCCYYLDVNIKSFPTATLTFHPPICLPAYLIQKITV